MYFKLTVVECKGTIDESSFATLRKTTGTAWSTLKSFQWWKAEDQQWITSNKWQAPGIWKMTGIVGRQLAVEQFQSDDKV
jgi:hypothetical protein